MRAERVAGMAIKDGELACSQGCGKTFKEDGAWRAKHELKCKGKVQTRGRIDRLAARRGSPAPTPTPVARPKAPPVEKAGKIERVLEKTVAISVPAQILREVVGRAVDELRVYRDEIDKTIAALEALRA